MLDMNARADLDHVPEKQVAADFLKKTFGLHIETHIQGLWQTLLQHTLQHLTLVAISLAAAIVLAVPLGILAASRPRLGQGILAVTGIIQTIPSIALLVLLIPLPLMGTGIRPAIVALFLYSLLPIVQNTHAGLHGIPANLRESAQALGLPARARLRLVELPLAARSILAGIKIAAVINVGTATLGGFIGAGGYGELIFAGIRQDYRLLILEGAIPAAVLALLVQGLFELAERAVIPRGLRLKPEA